MTLSRALIVVQARMSSTRLPGKVLLPLAGEPAIVRMMERVRRVTRAERAIVATSDQPSDDVLVEVCRKHAISVVRGPLHDVLKRMIEAVPPAYDAVVRLTGDCPLVDPALVDAHLACYAKQQHAEYVTNAVARTYPIGLDVEVVRRDCLVTADREATEPPDREHVTPWVQRHARTVSMTQAVDLSAMRWVLDTQSDYDSIAAIYSELYPKAFNFDSRMIYRLLLTRPDLVRVAGTASTAELLARVRELLAQENPR